MSSNKILVAVFVILFVILIGEIGYLFYSSQQKSTLSNNLADQTLATEQIAPSLLPKREGTQAISDDVLNVLSRFNKEVIVSSTLENLYKGKVAKIEREDGLKITLMGKNGVTNYIHFFEKELERIAIFRNQGEQNEGEIMLDDLKIGDQITISLTLNLLEEDLTNNLLEAKITVNNK